MATAKLTPREREVLRLIAQGSSTKQIAFHLGIAFKTAVCHRSNISSKLEAKNAADVVVQAVQQGLIDLPHQDGRADTPHTIAYAPEEIERIRNEMRADLDNLSIALSLSRDLRLQMREARLQLAETTAEMVNSLHTPARHKPVVAA